MGQVSHPALSTLRSLAGCHLKHFPRVFSSFRISLISHTYLILPSLPPSLPFFFPFSSIPSSSWSLVFPTGPLLALQGMRKEGFSRGCLLVQAPSMSHWAPPNHIWDLRAYNRVKFGLHKLDMCFLPMYLKSGGKSLVWFDSYMLSGTQSPSFLLICWV